MKKSAITVFFLLGLLTACANITPSLKNTAAPESGAAYVAGQVTRANNGRGFAIVLVDAASGATYQIALGEDKALPADMKDQVVVVKLPPGKYSVTHWFTYGTLTMGRSKPYPITNRSLSAPFTASAGSVLWLGTFSAETEYFGFGVLHTIQPRIKSAEDAQRDFQNAFPLLAGLNFGCHMCQKK